MDTMTDEKLAQLLSSGDDQKITPEHRAWMNAQIEATLQKKARGELTYTSLDQARREFGLDES